MFKNQQYITVSGSVKNYVVLRKKRSEQNKKPLCKRMISATGKQNCNSRLRYIFASIKGISEKVGYMCVVCGMIYIPKKYTAMYYEGGFKNV